MRRANDLALGRLKVGIMNKTESEYDSMLAMQLKAGFIKWYCFEGMKFRLADKTFYNPDFIIMNDQNQIEVHEVKGFWRDDARVKIKVAAEMYPFIFKAIKKKTKKGGGGWEVEDFS